MTAHQRRRPRRALPPPNTCGKQGYSGTTSYPDLMCIDGVMRDMDADGWRLDEWAPPCRNCDPAGWAAWQKELQEEQEGEEA